MYGVKFACVYIEEILQWVPMSQVIIIKFYQHEGKDCAQFKLGKEVLESYVEYREIV